MQIGLVFVNQFCLMWVYKVVVVIIKDKEIIVLFVDYCGKDLCYFKYCCFVVGQGGFVDIVESGVCDGEIIF